MSIVASAPVESLKPGTTSQPSMLDFLMTLRSKVRSNPVRPASMFPSWVYSNPAESKPIVPENPPVPMMMSVPTICAVEVFPEPVCLNHFAGRSMVACCT
jgi:hypothetical protein